MRPSAMLALLAALLLSTARAATPEAGVQEDASIAIETPAKVVRHFDGSLRIGYADPLDLGQGCRSTRSRTGFELHGVPCGPS